ncbi:MAG: hypothetical protein H6736_06140 [Alphaproteobacteria bacterium]|nr:hypothetical protein [Alphaproteobacteria bacterium]
MLTLALLTPTASAQSLDARVDTMIADAQARYDARFGASPALLDETYDVRRRPSTVVTALQEVLDDLQAGGCIATATASGHAGGIYYGKSAEGDDHGGAMLAASLNVANGVMGGQLSDGVRFGTEASALGVHNRAGQIYADREDGGFLAGKWVRIAGRRGVFLTVTGTCEAPVDPATILDGWFEGGLVTTPPTELTLFLSPTFPYSGQGRSGFDAQCQAEADAASLAGTFRAVITDTTDPIHPGLLSRLTDGVPLFRPDGQRISDSLTDLIVNDTYTNIPNIGADGALAPTWAPFSAHVASFGNDLPRSGNDFSGVEMDCQGWNDTTTVAPEDQNVQCTVVDSTLGGNTAGYQALGSTCPALVDLGMQIYCVEI